MKNVGKPISFWVAAGCALAVAGCVTSQRHHASSVVDYLYPGDTKTVEKPGIPVLRLPLTVGIAFVPTARTGPEATISETKRTELMREIRTHFESLDFVRSIELIPSPYLRPQGGFTNLEQLRTMFGLDAVVLLSYDQVQFTGQDFTSISYWTLVGAYVVPAERNATHTMLDAAVYDIASRKLLFRAPGTSEIKGRATPVSLEDELRADRERGFEEAEKDLVKNLDAELARFKEEVKAKRFQAEIVREPGYTGAGSVGALTLLALLAMAGAARRSVRRI